MYKIKIEQDEKVSVCRGCLTADRRVVLLSEMENADLFFSLLGVQKEFCESPTLLCWECEANLRRIRTFQNRIQHAQFVIQQSLYESDGTRISSLSSLKIVHSCDINSTDDTDIEVKHRPSLKYGDNIIKEEFCTDENGIDLYHDNESTNSDNEVLNIDLEKLKRIDEDPEIKNEKENVIRKQSIKRYEHHATVKTLDVKMEKLYKRFAKVVLSEKEIEVFLERDRGHKKCQIQCKFCSNRYRRRVDLNRHKTFNHVKHKFPTKCLECNASVTSLDNLNAHWRKHNVYLKCDVCDWLSSSMLSMSRHHVRVHTKLYCCNSCDQTCRTLREFSHHYKETHERVICDHCSKSFVNKHSLQIHIKRHHTPATCHECNRTYAHYHVLENHYRMQHPELTRADNRTELAYCVECDKQFPSVYKYRRHLATAAKHTPPKTIRVPCPECGKVFARKIRMTNHYKSVHVNTTKHRCDICNKTFCSAFSARTHRQHVHEKIPMPKNKMCDICGRGFSTNRILINHRRTHTGERPYKCPYCPASFAQVTAMKTHEKTQHKHVLEQP